MSITCLNLKPFKAISMRSDFGYAISNNSDTVVYFTVFPGLFFTKKVKLV